MGYSKIIDEITNELELFKQEHKPYYGKFVDCDGVKCPICGTTMSFYLKGNFGGTLGVFECNCGYRDASVENASYYATSEDWNRFYEETKDIMF